MMGNNQKGKSSLIVEGRSDASMFYEVVDFAVCRVIVAAGKENVLGALEIIRGRKFPGVLAVVDADLDHLEGIVSPYDDVVVTDTHDIETMMLSSPSFHKVLLRHGVGRRGSVEVQGEEFERSAEQLLERLLAAGTRLGYLRWASKRHDWRIRFDEIDRSKIVDASTLVIREDRLETEVLRASSAGAGTWAEIQARATALVNGTHDPWQICSGHDLTTLLAIHISRITGTAVSRDIVEEDLNLAFSADQFRRTRVYASVNAWEQKYAPRRILRQ